MTIIRVQPWVILAAIRYGLPRLSYAHAESLQLIAQHADDLEPEWLRTIAEDVTRHCHMCRDDTDHLLARRALDQHGWETGR